MRICYDADQLTAAMAAVTGPVLLDRFIENAIELDVDALSDGDDVYIAAVMQHVEEAGVHSGDSACVLPAPDLTPSLARELDEVVKTLGRELGVVGLLNVQVAVQENVLYVLEVNPRASRTVPFASKATGLNLVDAACRIIVGTTLAELRLPDDPRVPSLVSVKAAVFPFARLAGADPVLGPEMRSTGEVMATATDLPTAFARAERAAAVRSQPRAPRFSPSATKTSPPSFRSRQPSPGSDFASSRRPRRPRFSQLPGSRSKG